MRMTDAEEIRYAALNPICSLRALSSEKKSTSARETRRYWKTWIFSLIVSSANNSYKKVSAINRIPYFALLSDF